MIELTCSDTYQDPQRRLKPQETHELLVLRASINVSSVSCPIRKGIKYAQDYRITPRNTVSIKVSIEVGSNL